MFMRRCCAHEAPSLPLKRRRRAVASFLDGPWPLGNPVNAPLELLCPLRSLYSRLPLTTTPRLCPNRPPSSWLDNLKNISTFSSVEDFWSCYNNVLPASKTSPNSNYHLFKDGVVPMWEDEGNKKGGKWIIR